MASGLEVDFGGALRGGRGGREGNEKEKVS